MIDGTGTTNYAGMERGCEWNGWCTLYSVGGSNFQVQRAEADGRRREGLREAEWRGGAPSWDFCSVIPNRRGGKEEEEKEEDREKHDCSYILVVVVVLYATAKPSTARDETLSLSLPPPLLLLLSRELKEREYIQHAHSRTEEER